MDRIDIGVIGGSGLYEMAGVEPKGRVLPETPFGAPSDEIVLAEIGGARVGFLPRHGRGHRLNPTEVPYRANVYALKSLGARGLVSVSAVGSMREEIEPGHLVIPDQLLDRTKGIRPATYFEGGVVAHVGFADPYCPQAQKILAEGARREGLTVHEGGTLVVMEGPQFSTRAESLLYRSWGVSVIGMTALPEAKLAREAELCYVTLAMSTDYDCWHEDEDDVTVEAVVATLQKNTQNAQRLLASTLGALAAVPDCACRHALQYAVITGGQVDDEARARLALLLGEG